MLSERTATAGGSRAPRSGSWVHIVEATRLQRNGRSARVTSPLKGNYMRNCVFYLTGHCWSHAQSLASLNAKGGGNAGDAMVTTGCVSLLMQCHEM